MIIEKWMLKNKYNLISFVLASLCMFLTLSYLDVLSTGDYSLIYGDLFMNYIPAIKNLCRDIINGESINFSWNICLGMNTTMYNAYYAYNPFNVLYLLFDSEETVTAAIIIIKSGLAAMCFRIFVNEVHRIDDWNGVIFSIYYSMCAFQVAFNTVNIIWLDAMFVLPMVFLNIYRLNKTGKFVKLAAWYAYIFLFQFYMGYMIGIASAIYFLLLQIVEWRQKNSKQIIACFSKYIGAVLVAVFIAAAVWLPTVCFMLDNSVLTEPTLEVVDSDIIHIMGQLFWGKISGMYVNLPNIYCGIPTLLLAVLFFASKDIKKDVKAIYGGLLGILLISCVATPLYMLWHAFNVPDGWTYRFSFIICFVLCSLAAQTIKTDLKLKCVVPVLIGIMTFELFSSIMYQNEFKSASIINVILLLAWSIVWLIYCKMNPQDRRLMLMVMVIGVMAECVTGYIGHEELLPNMSKIQYKLWKVSCDEAMDDLAEDKDFYRIDYRNNYNISGGMYSGYKSVSYFSTAELYRIRQAMSFFGIHTSPRIVRDYGLTPVSEMLLGIKYDVNGVIAKRDMTEEDMHVTLYENDDVLGLGYMVGADVVDYDFYDMSAFENINHLTSLMTGEEMTPFERINPERIYISGNGINLEGTDKGYLLTPGSIINDEENMNLTFHITGNSDKIGYAYIANETSRVNTTSEEYMLDGGIENELYRDGHLSVSYIKQLGKMGNESYLRIIPLNGLCEQEFADIFFDEYNPVVARKIYDNLKNYQFQIEEYHDGYIKGRIIVPNDKHILFTTIPYDKGWKLKVDGVEHDTIPILNGAFVAAEFKNPGEYELEFAFNPVGLMTGIVLSVVGIMALLGVILAEHNDILKKN